MNNRLLQKTRTGDEPSTTTFTYDRNGNQLTQTADGHTKAMTYDAFNHLVRVVQGNSVSVYAYRADGLRHSKAVNGHTTTHVWDRGSIILEMNGSGAVVNRFSRGLGHLIRSYHHGFYLFNARTDVVQRVDSSGNIIHTYRYDAFGNQLNGDEVNTNPFRFAGEYYDFETGFIYLRARFYNPAIGRFISEDPYWTIFNMQSSTEAILQAGNLFVFVMNNPVRFIDPSGLSALPVLKPIAEGAFRIFSRLLPRMAEGAIVDSGVYAARNIPVTTTSTAAPHNPANPPTVIVGGQTPASASAGVEVDIPATQVDVTMSQVHTNNTVVATALAREHVDEFVEEKQAAGYTVIFRSGSGNATNMTLRPLPRDPSGALSFYLVPPAEGRFTMTTMEAVNATGVFTAVRDGVNHVSVRPTDPTAIQGWRDSHPTALASPHPLTLIMMGITIRVR